VPELPEVEVVRRGLAPHVTGRTISEVEVLHPRPVRRHLAGPTDFVDRLVGRTLLEPARRGKYLWLPLEDGEAILAHLGMSGQLRVDEPGTTDQAHVRVRISFTDGGPEVRFCDQRMFGGMQVSQAGGGVPPEIAHIAPDPFEDAYDPEQVVARIRRRRTGVKRALLDQTVVSGVGNIYADEALWRVRVHPETPGSRIGVRKAEELLAHVRAVFAQALAEGGTSFDAQYLNVNGEAGYFSHSLNAYGRGGEPCNRCGALMKRVPFAGRSSHFCPRCQRRR